MQSRLLNGDILTTAGKCFVSQKTACGARQWRVPKETHLAEPSDFIAIEIKPNQFVLRHRLSVDLNDSSVTPNYTTNHLSFDVLGYIKEWPFIVPLANAIEYNTALSIAQNFNAEKYVSDKHNKEAEAIALKIQKESEKKSKLNREVHFIGCSINDAIDASLIKAKALVISLKRSTDIERVSNAEQSLRKMRHMSFDLEDYLTAYIHSNIQAKWPFGDYYTDIKLKLFGE